MRSSRHLLKTFALSALSTHVVLVAASCGSPNTTGTVTPVTQQLVIPPPPAGSSYASVNGVPANILTALQGTYGGTLSKRLENGSVASQPYTIQLAQPVVQGSSGQQYLYLKFDSSGPIGQGIHFEAFLGVAPSGFAGYYNFSTNSATIPEFASYAVSFELILSLTSQNQFNPTQSAIFIKDCGFNYGCSNIAQDVWFERDLVKR